MKRNLDEAVPVVLEQTLDQTQGRVLVLDAERAEDLSKDTKITCPLIGLPERATNFIRDLIVDLAEDLEGAALVLQLSDGAEDDVEILEQTTEMEFGKAFMPFKNSYELGLAKAMNMKTVVMWAEPRTNTVQMAGSPKKLDSNTLSESFPSRVEVALIGASKKAMTVRSYKAGQLDRTGDSLDLGAANLTKSMSVLFSSSEDLAMQAKRLFNKNHKRLRDEAEKTYSQPSI